ncbi:putative metal-binding protein [Flavisphingomonas formosensis]|uniref:putative metal-binding protein n=1 Tax=Flavisphingomonas formosensis TaxID=861534 RepID=UPI0012F9036B|nr:putative metal-binding protein [Sphingomonas formosensis]
MPEAVQSVDPVVTRAKFDREVGRFRDQEVSYRRRGILLQEVAFPTVTIAFCGFKMKPAPLLGAVRIDFTDYDLMPPSVRFVDPLTHDVLLSKDLTLALPRLPKVEGTPKEMLVAMMAQGIPVAQLGNLVQSSGPDEMPFLCLPGVREYHEHPAHTGDSWLLHRASGEGCLAFIVENIWKYGPRSMERYLVQVATEAEGLRMQALVEAQRIQVAASLTAMSE